MRWHEEGLPNDCSPQEYFEYEIIRVFLDTSPRFPEKVLTTDESYTVRTTSYGQVIKHRTGIPNPFQTLEHPITSKDDWRKLRGRLEADEDRLIRFQNKLKQPWLGWRSALEEHGKWQSKGKMIAYSDQVGFGLLHRYMGVEGTLITMAEDPEWVKEMAIAHANLLISMHEILVRRGFTFEALYLSNDMGGKGGPLFSPQFYMDQLFPADRLLYEYFSEKGMPLILHSDGNIEALIPLLIKAGFSCLEPFEVKAGQDFFRLYERYADQIVLMGGIDVRLMSDDRELRFIDEEIRRKFAAAKKYGRYIYHSDHSIPDNVSFSRYKSIIDLIKRYGVYE
jgi:uroporphyrinogen decarboxylase